MGGCASSKPADRPADAVPAALARMRSEEQTSFKVLFLGSGESGKSTLFKQLQLLYGTKLFDDTTRAGFRPYIIRGLIKGTQDVVSFCSKTAGLALEPEYAAAGETVSAAADDWDESWPPGLAQAILKLQESAKFKEAIARGNEFQLPDKLLYFYDRLVHGDVAEDSYIPSEQDVVSARVRTTGITEARFEIDRHEFIVYDVGGQRNERKKWMHVFDSVNVVFFLAAVSEFDQHLYEDATQNRLEESLTLFSEVSTARFFEDTRIVLLLTKLDAFTEKVRNGGHDLSAVQAALTEMGGSPTSPDDVLQAIKNMYIARGPQNKKILTFETTATDKASVKKTFDRLPSVVIETALDELNAISDGTEDGQAPDSSPHDPDDEKSGGNASPGTRGLGSGAHPASSADRLLSRGARAGFVDIVHKALLDGASADCTDNKGHTPLISACRGGHRQIVLVLLGLQRDPSSSDEAATFVQQGAKALKYTPARVNFTDHEGRSALSYAATSGATSDLCRALIFGGADVNSRCKHDRTPLSYAAQVGHLHIVELLLQSGADPNAPGLFISDQLVTPLMIAVMCDHATIVHAILAKPETRLDARTVMRRSALDFAALYGHSIILTMIVAKGPELGRPGYYNALMYAASGGNPDCVRRLLQPDTLLAKIDETETNGLSALHIACEKRRAGAVAVLLEFGARVDVRGEGDQLPWEMTSDPGVLEVFNRHRRTKAKYLKRQLMALGYVDASIDSVLRALELHELSLAKAQKALGPPPAMTKVFLIDENDPATGELEFNAFDVIDHFMPGQIRICRAVRVDDDKFWDLSVAMKFHTTEGEFNREMEAMGTLKGDGVVALAPYCTQTLRLSRVVRQKSGDASSEAAELVVDDDDHTGRYVVVMESGLYDLEEFITQNWFNVTHLQRLQIFSDASQALHRLHSLGWAHNDVKPKNLVFMGAHWVYIDFDAGRRLGEPVQGYTQHTCSPEVLRAGISSSGADLGTSTVESDLFSLGMLAFFLFSDRGQYYWADKAAAEAMGDENWEVDESLLVAQVAGQARPLLRRLLEADPRKRMTWKQLFERELLTGKTLATFATHDLEAQFAAMGARQVKMLQNQGKMLDKLDSIGLGQAKLHKRFSNVMLDMVTKIDDLPNLFLLLPTKQSGFHPSHAFTQKHRLFFLCEGLTPSVAGDDAARSSDSPKPTWHTVRHQAALEVTLTKTWFQKAIPFLRASIFLVGLVGKLGGFGFIVLGDLGLDASADAASDAAQLEKLSSDLRTLSNSMEENPEASSQAPGSAKKDDTPASLREMTAMLDAGIDLEDNLSETQLRLLDTMIQATAGRVQDLFGEILSQEQKGKIGVSPCVVDEGVVWLCAECQQKARELAEQRGQPTDVVVHRLPRFEAAQAIVELRPTAVLAGDAAASGNSDPTQMGLLGSRHALPIPQKDALNVFLRVLFGDQLRTSKDCIGSATQQPWSPGTSWWWPADLDAPGMLDAPLTLSLVLKKSLGQKVLGHATTTLRELGFAQGESTRRQVLVDLWPPKSNRSRRATEHVAPMRLSISLSVQEKQTVRSTSDLVDSPTATQGPSTVRSEARALQARGILSAPDPGDPTGAPRRPESSPSAATIREEVGVAVSAALQDHPVLGDVKQLRESNEQILALLRALAVAPKAPATLTSS